MAIEKVLVVDDESLMRHFLAETLRRKQLDVTIAENGMRAYHLLKDHAYDLVITDLKMPDMTGLDVLRRVKELSPATIVIVVTAFGSVENAVEAMRLGAFNYLIKPFSPDTIEAMLEKANEQLCLLQENQYLRLQVSGLNGSSNNHFDMVAHSPALKKILEHVQQIAKSHANVFITGESGTGKEVIAQAIHHYSLRAQHPFIKVNCAAIPETLIESEFFGHEKGSFTGANAKRLGRFELANTGTLLLDEITEVPLSLQAKLLRVIQEHEFERVGGTKVVKVDVRLISTSNRDVQQAIRDKVLREDLYYRLNVVPIHLPPLRERTEDIIPLAEHFIKKFCSENHKELKRLSSQVQQRLVRYPWPGNVRELANVIERAVVMDNRSEIGIEHLYLNETLSDSAHSSESSTRDSVMTLPVGMTLQELEKRLIIETLAKYSSRAKTAEILGISVRTLRNRLQEYNIQD